MKKIIPMLSSNASHVTSAYFSNGKVWLQTTRVWWSWEIILFLHSKGNNLYFYSQARKCHFQLTNQQIQMRLFIQEVWSESSIYMVHKVQTLYICCANSEDAAGCADRHTNLSLLFVFEGKFSHHVAHTEIISNYHHNQALRL